MQRDAQATVRALNERRAIFAERAAARGGRIVNAPGDSILEFPSVIDAVESAVEIQKEIAARNAAIANAEERMQFRIGINLGDVIVEDGALYGDGVNIAARLESLADYGGIALRRAPTTRCATRRLSHRRSRHRAGEEHRAADPRLRRRHERDRRQGTAQGVSAPRAPVGRRRRGGGGGGRVCASLACGTASPSARGDDRGAAFANHSADPKREFFSDGLTEDINALGRFSAIRVIAYNTVQAYKMRVAAPEQIMRELGVRYLVLGSVREAGGTLRINVELSDAAKGTLLWSERYDGPGREVFTMQDRIVGDIVGTLAVKLNAIEQQRAAMKPPESLEAYEPVPRARADARGRARGEPRGAR